MIHTKSATPLAAVMVESSPAGGCHVWLRKNITEAVETFDGVETTIYEADELSYYSADVVTVEEVEADFSSLWMLHENDGLTDAERAQAKISELEAALVELADLLGGE